MFRAPQHSPEAGEVLGRAPQHSPRAGEVLGQALLSGLDCLHASLACWTMVCLACHALQCLPWVAFQSWLQF